MDGYDRPLTLAGEMTIGDDGIHVDYSGTSPASAFGIGPVVREMPMRRDAADVEPPVRIAIIQRLLQGRSKRGIPVTIEGQQPAEDGDQRLCRIDAACMRDRQAGAVKGGDACRLPRIAPARH